MTDPVDRAEALRKARAAAESEFDRDTVAIEACDPGKTWIDIKLVDDEGEPIPGARFQVFRSDGSLLGEGTLGDDGCGGFENIDDARYTVCFPDLDERAWEPAP